MSFNNEVWNISNIQARVDLTENQFNLVRVYSNGVDLASSENEYVLGVLLNEPKSGQNAIISISPSISKVKTGDKRIIKGDFLKAGSNPIKVEPAVSADDVIIGIALESSRSEDEIISVQLIPMGKL